MISNTTSNHATGTDFETAFQLFRQQFDRLSSLIVNHYPRTHSIHLESGKLRLLLADLVGNGGPKSASETAKPAPTSQGEAGYCKAERPFYEGLPGCVHCLDYDHPKYRGPEKGEFILGLYIEEGRLCPVLLWADPAMDIFYHVGEGGYISPPRFYIRIERQGGAAENFGLTKSKQERSEQ
jgi:hypothetical protein